MTTTNLQPRPIESATRQMELRGVRVHNLKNINLDIPLGRLVVISGVSGSGKSSLAFETLFAEGQRRYNESFSIAARQHLERIDRPDADRVAHVPPAIAIRSDCGRRSRHDGRSTVATVADVLDGLRLLFARLGRIVCPTCHLNVRAHSAADVVLAINSLPVGTRCQIGFAVNDQSEPGSVSTWLARGFSRAIWNDATHELSAKPEWPVAGDVWLVVDRLVTGKASPQRLLESAESAMREGGGQCWLLRDVEISDTNDVRVVDGRHWQTLRFNRRLVCSTCGREFLPLEPRLFNHLSSGACLTCRATGHVMNAGSGNTICPACNGTRFRDESRAVRLANLSIADVCHLTPSEVLAFLRSLDEALTPGENRQTELIRADLVRRFTAVCDLGLDYLTLDRSAGTLSGGETRRLMLAAVIGSRITGTLVVVDEPSAGLSASELSLVIQALRRVLALRNSLIVVEHSPVIVSAADHVIELGPGAGPAGGNVVYQGPPLAPFNQEGRPVATIERKSVLPPGLRLTNVHHHNFRDDRVEFPLNRICVVAGPSGSGKTTLVTQILYPSVCQRLGLPCEIPFIGTGELSGGEALVDAVMIDQSPLTKSPRSNPATWLEVFDEIRQTFAATADAKQHGFTAQHFSFNSSSGGRCRGCLGTGLLKQDLQFLPDVTLVCPECGGTRYRREILDVKYRGRSITDVLSMSVSDAATFFRSQPRVQQRFQMLKQIGLDYLVLGQPSETLSGGEAQRLKLAARLTAPSRGACLIVCDEPTTGLHPTDVGRLVTCFRELIANGHTLVLADNSPELIAAADHVIELESSRH